MAPCYKLTFKPGAKRVTLYTIKNFMTRADIDTILRRNIMSFKDDKFVVYDKNGKIVNKEDVIFNGCTYRIERQPEQTSPSRSTKPLRSKKKLYRCR